VAPARTFELPPDLPVPEDDGACAHLTGLTVPAVALPTTAGRVVDLAEQARTPTVLYLYPRTGRPDEPHSPEWELIPGARG